MFEEIFFCTLQFNFFADSPAKNSVSNLIHRLPYSVGQASPSRVGSVSVDSVLSYYLLTLKNNWINLQTRIKGVLVKTAQYSLSIIKKPKL
jgi:hypothetical protein